MVRLWHVNVRINFTMLLVLLRVKLPFRFRWDSPRGWLNVLFDRWVGRWKKFLLGFHFQGWSECVINKTFRHVYDCLLNDRLVHTFPEAFVIPPNPPIFWLTNSRSEPFYLRRSRIWFLISVGCGHWLKFWVREGHERNLSLTVT